MPTMKKTENEKQRAVDAMWTDIQWVINNSERRHWAWNESKRSLCEWLWWATYYHPLLTPDGRRRTFTSITDDMCRRLHVGHITNPWNYISGVKFKPHAYRRTMVERYNYMLDKGIKHPIEQMMTTYTGDDD